MAGSQEIHKNRNDPGRFFGDGVIFKAKLIGILEVGEARGDRMCQEALQDLKTAIRAAGEHKQRITINVTIDGLRLRDERTGDSLYHHPVHKISFIAQDMTDSRAFGYIFGSPESGHRFFGIKTDKAASQVVLAMRDLFQVVFELKKKEIELARQHIHSKTIHDHQPTVTLSIKSTLDASHATFNKDHIEPNVTSKYSHKEVSPESVADLVDLEQELSSIQRGITQMERITPIDPPVKNQNDDDPFGDSFTQYPTYNLLPPPESSKSRHAKQLKSSDDNYTPSTIATSSVEKIHKTKSKSPSDESWLNPKDAVKSGKSNQKINSESRNGLKSSNSATAAENIVATDDNVLQPISLAPTSSSITHYIDAFSDLDPLGTGKIRPCIDKKYFFQDLKNPPKKVLKDLSDRDGFSTSFSADLKNAAELSIFQEKSSIDNAIQKSNLESKKSNEQQKDEFVAQFASSSQIFSPNNNGTHGTPPNLSRSSENVAHSYANQTSSFPGPYDNISNIKIDDSVDPFSPRMRNFDPFDDEFSKPSNTFDFSFSEAFSEASKPAKHLFNGPLQDVRRLQESDSYSENEGIPEPPPRPDTNLQTDPPPLPPKKQFSDIVIRPRVTSPLAMSNETSRYGVTKHNHVNHDQQSGDDPPSIPLPSRRIGRSDSNASYPGPGRPEKEVPLLLPPPKTKGSIKNRTRRSEECGSNHSDSGKKSSGKSDTENANTNASPIVKSIPDITLSQLLTLGIDDLASKLNVPSSKLNTMTIVELTKYLSDYIEKSSQKNVFNPSDSPSVPVSTTSTSQQEATPPTSATASTPAPKLQTASESSAVFKVSFDDSNDSTFIAKFDDDFGMDSDFIPNFDHFNQTQNLTIDKYAVFREIIDQEMQGENSQPTDAKPSDESVEMSSDAESPINEIENQPLSSKIDTKITQAISQAKDRYAALRDIILVEDLFEKPSSAETPADERLTENVDNSLTEEIEKEFDVAEQSSPEANISINLEDHDDLDPLKTITTPTISQPILSSKDDLEIDEYMNRAISNLSLDSRDHLSPLSKSVTKSQNASTSPLLLQYKKSPTLVAGIDEEPTDENNARKTTLNDMSTSPIPLQASSIVKTATIESFSMSKSPASLIIVGIIT